jgi:undecaprenyl-diphosphatase
MLGRIPRSTLSCTALLLALAALAPAALYVPVCAARPAVSAVAASSSADDGALGLPEATLLGVVEGLTEYLPVSSTGHLLLAEQALGISSNPKRTSAADAYAICIQFGAILAVALLYWRRLASMLRGVVGRDRVGRHLALALLVSFVPAAVCGVAAERFLKAHLFALWPITAAWLTGGVLILALARRERRTGRRASNEEPLEGLTLTGAVAFSAGQRAPLPFPVVS